MRRPVRPFVTEYRGGSRRPSGQGHGPEVDLFKAEPGPNGAGSWPPAAPPQPDLQEDGYDAALRAADALLAGHRTAANPPAADGEMPKPGSGGRVLRVLDEAPSPEMMRLEQEFAPKKRGRKPGSKNKPKIAALAAPPAHAVPQAAADEAPVVPAVASGPTVTSVISHPGVTSLAAVLTDAAIAAARKASAPRPATPPGTAPAAGSRGERYAWVRTRLKPGQQWKRRLPKVAW